MILQTHDLIIGYRPDIVVAKSLDLSLNGGQLVCLLGPNGVGKSTLLRTIAGMQKPLAGQVMLSGTDITRLNPRQIAARLSVVLTERPNVGLLNGYALVALGRHPYTDWMGRLSRHDKTVIRWAVDAVGATDLADRPVMELSDGQRQKLLIARALAQESDVILLDEPTAFLDLPHRAEIMHLLRHLAVETGRAILLSSHDLDLALRSADRLWLMADGRMRTGVPEDLVISGAFEAAFKGEGVAFDRATGMFHVQRESGYRVDLVGNGVSYAWTCRALKRTGFALANGDSSLRVEIHGDDDDPVWYVYRGTAESVHKSIEDLLRVLQDHRATVAGPQPAF